MMTKRRKRWSIAGAVVLVLVLAGLLGASGCGDEGSESPGYGGAPSTTDGYYAEKSGAGVALDEAASSSPEAAPGLANRDSGTDSLTELQSNADQKIMANAELEVEVEAGRFQAAFSKALLLADRYGGYVLESNSFASGAEDDIKSGTIALRIPAVSFDNAMNDAAALGELKAQRVGTQDVTADYYDLQARIAVQQQVVDFTQTLFAKAKTIDEILQLQQTLAYQQEQLEQLKGQMRYLEEHTAYSTLTITLYEAGAATTPPNEWGFVKAVKDAVHNLVDAFSAVVRGLGWIIPVAVVLVVIGLAVYLLVRAATRKNRRGAQMIQPQERDREDKTS